MRWSVSLQAETENVLSLEQIVEFADAVAVHSGIATGAGTSHYGAQLVVTAESDDEAVAAATELFREAAATAGLPSAPVTHVEAISEDDEL